MKQPLRIFPTLTLLNNDLVKTIDYKNPRYLGDPINAIKLFNNKNVDEISILDISNRFNNYNNQINFPLLQEMAQEAFIPLSYGGNIKSLFLADKIINLGFEKVIINSLLFENPLEVNKIVTKIGSQSVVLKLDYIVRNEQIVAFYNEGKNFKEFTLINLLEFVKASGVGEIIFSRKDFDGKMKNYDYQTLQYFLDKITIPIVLAHGAKDKYSIKDANDRGFLNFTASSMYVYYGNLKAVLINDPFFNI